MICLTLIRWQNNWYTLYYYLWCDDVECELAHGGVHLVEVAVVGHEDGLAHGAPALLLRLREREDMLSFLVCEGWFKGWINLGIILQWFVYILIIFVSRHVWMEEIISSENIYIWVVRQYFTFVYIVCLLLSSVSGTFVCVENVT